MNEMILDRQQIHENRVQRSVRLIQLICLIASFAAIGLIVFFIDRKGFYFILGIQLSTIASAGVVAWIASRRHLELASHLIFIIGQVLIWVNILTLEGMNDGRTNIGHYYFIPLGLGMSFFLGVSWIWRHFYLWSSILSFLCVQLGFFHFSAIDPLEPDSHLLGFRIVTLASMILTGALITIYVHKTKTLEDSIRITNDAVYALLENMLPTHIVQQILKTGKIESQLYEDCSVMILDLVKYSRISDSGTLTDLQKILEDFYQKVDGYIVESGLEKIKTVGDAYLITSGVLKPRADHAQQLVNLGIRILRDLNDEGSLAVRIGIASGPLLAGVIGKTKLAFDVWGGTVNFASRLQTNARPNSLVISESSYKILSQKNEFQKSRVFLKKDQKKVDCYVYRLNPAEEGRVGT